MSSEIQGWTHAYPDLEHWGGWSPGASADGVADGIAGTVAETAEGRAQLRRSVLAVNDTAVAEGGSVGTAAVWVPDRATGEVRGILLTRRQGFRHPREADPQAFIARNWRRDYGGWRVRITERSAEVFACDAGRGVVETIVGRLRGERTVQAYSSFFVFPHDGTPEAVQLAFNTVHLDQLVELTVLGRSITESLEITTGPAT